MSVSYTHLDVYKRQSWGRVGNDKGVDSRFMYMPAVWGSSGSYSFGVDNPISQSAAAISRMGNPAVTWETADKQNYGIDLKFFNSRLSATFDYFIEHRTGILISPESTPSIIATALPNLNIGKVDNHGYEVSLGWRDKIGKDFTYNVDANVSFARNKILYMDEVPKQFSYMNQTGGSTGRQTGVYNYIRLYQYSDFITGADGELTLKPELPQPYQKVYPGDAMYADLNGDHIVDGNDKSVAGYATRPEYVFGMNMGFDWKGFNFTMQWVGSKNVNRMYDIEYRIPYTNAGKRGLLTYFYDGCWTPENQLGAVYPRPSEESESWKSEPSTLWLVDASYLRLKSLSFGYTITGKKFLKKLGLSSLGLNFSGYNLLTFSPLKYLDPESDPNRFGDYPLIKVYSLSLIHISGSEEARLAMRDMKSIYVDLNRIDEFAALANAMPGHIRFDASEQDSLTYAAAEKIYARGRTEEAKSSLNKYLQTFPEGAFSLNAHYYLCQIGNEQKNYDMVLLHSGKLLEYPNNPFAEEALIMRCLLYTSRCV